VGGGSAAYVSTRLGRTGLAGLLPELLAPAGVGSELPDAARGVVELTVRRNADSRYLFLVNRTDETVPLTGLSGELLVGSAGEDGFPVLSPREVAVVSQPAT
jgi:beta-galactosidase